MKNRLIITVSDVKSTKSYNVHQMVKKLFLSVALIAFLIIGGSFWFISYLSEKVETVKKEKETQVKILEEKEKTLLSQNELYSLQIKEKIDNIEELSSKLDYVNSIIGVDKDATIEEISKKTLESINLEKKKFTLRVIPSGSPLKINKLSAKFGYRIHPITKRRKFHRGIDLASNMGTKVRATADGVAGFVQNRNIGDYGRVINLQHNYGFKTIYAHLKKTLVKNGDIVRKGQVIGLTGNSGRSTGPHLHYEIKHGNKVLDPKNFMSWKLKNYDTIFKKERKVKWESLINLINEHHNPEQR